jgi:ABC-type polysaccharide/polyol phosphate transport system ATPase subunit
MSARAAIVCEKVSKYFYRHAGRALLRKHVEGWLRRAPKERFYALRDVTFRIQQGESVALVGTNGAGKSTLLSLVTGLVSPDAGRFSVEGRIGPLLQLGAGLHPDLTGAENVRLNAALLGFTRRRTSELFDSIVEFAGIADFIAEPLRTYSSGMAMRLAFSVAAHLDPDILIIDEVLSVGDHAFQVKCAEKMASLKRSGKTLLCVSHSAGAIEGLCERALWLERGELVMDGPVREVLDAYEGRPPSRQA